jgi:hypothetical protein
MKDDLTNFWKWGNEISANLRQRRFSEFKSENSLLKAWNELWKESSIVQKPGGPVLFKIRPEQMKWIPYIYLYSYQLSHDLNKTTSKLDFFGIRRNKQKKFADVLEGYSDILKELLFTENEDLKNFLFSDDIIQNGGGTILITRLEFNELMKSVLEGH